MPIARTSRGRCNTTHDQVALANSRVLATRWCAPRGTADGRVIVRRITLASTCFRTLRGAPVKSDSPRSPFIAAGGAPNVDRWPGMEACEQRSVRLSLAGHVSPRRLWSERVEDAIRHVRFRESMDRREPRLAVPTCTFCRRAGLARRRNTSYALQRAKAPHVRPLASPCDEVRPR
jgi:hypothetical protein